MTDILSKYSTILRASREGDQVLTLSKNIRLASNKTIKRMVWVEGKRKKQ